MTTGSPRASRSLISCRRRERWWLITIPTFPASAGMRHYPDLDLISTPLTAQTLKQADLVLLITDHTAYDYAWIASQARLIVDTRNAFKGVKEDHIYLA